MRAPLGLPSRPFASLGAVGCLALLLACRNEAAPQNAAPPPTAADAAGGQEPAPEPSQPQPIQIKVAGPYATAGSEGNQASVLTDGSGTLQWGIAGGALTSDASGPSVTYSVGDPGQPLRLFCKLKDAAGHERGAMATQIIVFPPVLEEFKAVPEKVTLGLPGALQWSAREIKSLTLDPGGQDVSKVGGISINPTTTTTYTLRGENLAGTVVTKQVTVAVVPPPVISAFHTGGPVPAGQPMTLIAEFKGGRAEVRQGDKVLGSATTSPYSIQVTAADQAVFTLVVTNDAGVSTSQTLGFSFTSAYK